MLVFTFLAAVIGTLGILLATTYYVKSLVVHPDGIVTVFNKTTHRRTQSYLIGDLQIYIDETYRMNMDVFQRYVNLQSMTRNGKEVIPEGGDEALSLIKDNPSANPNPFVMKLKIKNLNTIPRFLYASDFKIRSGDKLLTPNAAWQETLARAGFYAGTDTNEKAIIRPGEEKVLWLVYASETTDNPYEQEYVRVYYGAQSEWLAVKVEFPFNYVQGTPYRDYNEITSGAYTKGAIAILLFYSALGVLFFRKVR